MTTKEVAFIMINPFDVFPTYEIDLSQDVLDELHIESEQDVDSICYFNRSRSIRR